MKKVLLFAVVFSCSMWALLYFFKHILYNYFSLKYFKHEVKFLVFLNKKNPIIF